jgi:hypothetical protein
VSHRPATGRETEAPVDQFIRRLLRGIRADRSDIDNLTVERVERYGRTNQWGHLGEIEVTYNRAGHRAVYGFNWAGDVSCYMD